VAWSNLHQVYKISFWKQDKTVTFLFFLTWAYRSFSSIPYQFDMHAMVNLDEAWLGNWDCRTETSTPD
jgi:hypothetical protein